MPEVESDVGVPAGDCDRWSCISLHDPSGRRGVWVSLDGGRLDVRAGREGGDKQVSLVVGQVLTRKNIEDLADALLIGHWMLEEKINHLASELAVLASGLDWSSMEVVMQPLEDV